MTPQYRAEGLSVLHEMVRRKLAAIRERKAAGEVFKPAKRRAE